MEMGMGIGNGFENWNWKKWDLFQISTASLREQRECSNINFSVGNTKLFMSQSSKTVWNSAK